MQYRWWLVYGFSAMLAVYGSGGDKAGAFLPSPNAEVKKNQETLPTDNAEPDQRSLDIETLKAAGIPNEGAALLKFFKQRTVTQADRERLLELIRQFGDESFDVREKAAEEVENIGLAAIGLLRQAERDSNDPEVVRRAERCLARIEKVPTRALSSAAARLLAVHKPEGAAQVLLDYLPLAEDDAIVEDIRGSLAQLAMRDGKPEPVLLQALDSPDASRRGAAAEALIRAYPEPIRPRLRQVLAQEKDPTNRVRFTIAFVTGPKLKEFMPNLIDLLAEMPPELSWQAEDILCRLAGDDAPKVSLAADVETRRKCREAWLNWWNANRDKVDLAKLDEAGRLLGYTLIMEMDFRGQGGRVVELGPDGKERWKITNVQFVLDAQVVSGNRVLIAEHNIGRVTERELTGKIVWQQNLPQPLAVQRLANGNTFAAGRERLVEWDRQQRQVFVYNRPQYDIVAACKTRNGQMLYMTQNGQVVRLDPQGKEIKSFNIGRVNYYSAMQALPNNRVLLTTWNSIAEYDLDTGKPVWTIPVNTPTSVQRLPNGNTLVASMNTMKVMELDRNGKTVWEYKPQNNNRPWRASRR